MNSNSSNNNQTELTTSNQFHSNTLPSNTMATYQTSSSISNSASAEQEFSLRVILQFFQRHWILITKSIVISLTLGILYCIFSPRQYKSEAMLEIKGYAPVFADSVSEEMIGMDTRKVDYQNTMISKLRRHALADLILSNRNLALDVLAYASNKPSFLKSILSSFGINFEKSSKLTNYYEINSAQKKQDPNAEEEEELTKLKGDFIESKDHYRLDGKLLDSYLKLIQINPVKDTSLVEISVTTSNPQLSKRLANAHARGFIQLNHREQQRSLESSLRMLRSQAKELKEKVSTTQKNIAEYAESNELVAISNIKDANFKIDEIVHLTRLLAEATGRRIEAESALKELREVNGSPEVQQSILGVFSEGDDDASRDIRFKLHQAEAEYNELSQRFTPTYPKMKELKAKIISYQRSLSSERGIGLERLRSAYKRSLAEEQKLILQIESVKERANAVSKRLVQYTIMQREADSLRDLYDSVLKQIKQREVMVATVPNNILVSDYAVAAEKPSSPLIQLIIAISLILGTILGIIIAITKDLMKATFQSESELIQEVSLPFLGSIPSFALDSLSQSPPKKIGIPFKILKKNNEAQVVIQNNDTNDETTKDLSLENLQNKKSKNSSYLDIDLLGRSDSIFAEALRTIRASILYSAADNTPKVFLVTSPNKGDGKTSVSANLAASLAQASYKTLLIDGDLRQGRIHHTFPCDHEQKGLVDALVGHVSIESTIQKSNITGLSIITRGSTSPNPAELIGSHRLVEFITQFQQQFDYVIIDGPPVLLLSDSLALSRVVQATILVVRSLKTNRKSVHESIRRLKRVGAKILGVVLNEADPKTFGYDSEIYSSYIKDETKVAENRV
jgi:polysaccharide biosynthesis transport protein